VNIDEASCGRKGDSIRKSMPRAFSNISVVFYDGMVEGRDEELQ
jgi:hypothetical protein